MKVPDFITETLQALKSENISWPAVWEKKKKNLLNSY